MEESEKRLMLARAITALLNKLIEDPDVRKDIAALIEARIPASQATVDHPDIVVYIDGPHCFFGALGLINGILGSDHRIAAFYDDGAKLTGFDLIKTSGHMTVEIEEGHAKRT